MDTKLETNELQVTRNIKSCRERIGMTQEMMARKLKITRTSYTNMENNPFRYSYIKLKAVADVIGCTLNDFLLEK